MTNLIIDHIIPKKAEGTYYTIPFNVPDGLEWLLVTCSYEKIMKKTGKLNITGWFNRKANIVDFGLMDNHKRFIGWEGHLKKSSSFGTYSSIKEYNMNANTPGEWNIIIGVYVVPDDGLKVRYEIEFIPQQD